MQERGELLVLGAWWGERFRRTEKLKGSHLKEAIDSFVPKHLKRPPSRPSVAAMLQQAARITAAMKARTRGAKKNG